MATKIRLRRTGTTNQAAYRLVVADTRSPRDGRFIETLGHYTPRLGDDALVVNVERVAYWLGKGAQISAAARPLLKKAKVPLPTPVSRKKRTTASVAPAAPETVAPEAAASPTA
jgi:small subunit ribosomal protein S16